MAPFRTPLPALSAGLLESAINGVLALDEQSAGRLQRMSGKSVLVVLEGTGLQYHFSFDAQKVAVTPHDSADEEVQANTAIRATPAALFSMAAEEIGEGWSTPGSSVTINGDASLARDFERLFSRLDPDLEGLFAGVFGDVIGHQVAVGLREGARRAKETASSAGEVLGEVLQEGARGNRSGPLIGKADFENFAGSVDDLRDAVERLEAKLKILAQNRADPDPRDGDPVEPEHD